MRFVPIKTVEQQSVLALHRVREALVKARTSQANQIRGLLAEFGLILPEGIEQITARVPQLIEDAQNELTGSFRLLVDMLLEHFKQIARKVDELEQQILRWHRSSADSRRLAEVPGIGALTATALVASIGDARNFRDGRQVAAWLGLVPRQHSSGGKANLLGISKRGDGYLRRLLVHGARAVVYWAQRKSTPDRTQAWVSDVATRRNPNVAAVALANKNARTVWALLAHERQYMATYA